MKKLLFALVMVAVSVAAMAQIKTPAPSPSASIEQTIGLTEVTVEYSRPAVKGRKIFGELVPFGEWWRTGANKATKISFDSDVKFGGKDVKAGDYALFTKPGKDSWEVVLYTETEIWGTPREWDVTKEAAHITVKPMALPVNIESFMIGFDGIVGNKGTMEMLWEKTFVSIEIETEVDAAVEKSIAAAIAGTTQGEYYTAARYYYDNDKDLNKAAEWIHAANNNFGEKRFWQVRMEALIMAKMGKKADAIKLAKESMALAEKAGNKDYVRMNEKSIKEWM